MKIYSNNNIHNMNLFLSLTLFEISPIAISMIVINMIKIANCDGMPKIPTIVSKTKKIIIKINLVPSQTNMHRQNATILES